MILPDDERIDVVLPSGGISGKLVLREGKRSSPLPGCTVQLHHASHPWQLGSIMRARSGAEGQFEFRGLEAGAYELLVPYEGEFLGRSSVKVAKGRIEHVTVDVVREMSIRVSVRGVHRKDRTVHVRALRHGQPVGRVTTVSGSGFTRSIRGLRMGPCEVEVSCGVNAKRSLRKTVSVGPDLLKAVVFDLDTAELGSVYGILGGTPGTRMFPISDVIAVPHGKVPLSWTFRYAVVRGAEYRIVGLAPGSWDIYAFILGRTYRRVRLGTVELKARDSVRCDLRRGTGCIKLELVDSMTGSPFRASRARAQCRSLTGAHEFDTAAKNTTELQLADILPGEYQIHLKVTGRADWHQRASVGLRQTIELTVPLAK